MSATDHLNFTLQVTNIVNGVERDRRFATIDAVNADPTLARFQLRAGNQWIDGGQNRTIITEFYGAGQQDASRTAPLVVDTDEPPALLGHDKAPSAGEYVLDALAACLTGTIIDHGAARGIPLDGLEGTIEGGVDRHGSLGLNDDVRPGYESIRVAFKAAGDFDDDQLADSPGRARPSGHRQQPRRGRHHRGLCLRPAGMLRTPPQRP